MSISYLIAFVASALCSLLFTRRVRDFALAHGWAKSAESSRHVHLRPVPRLGGVAIFLSVTFVVLSASLFPRAFGAPLAIHGRMAGILGPASLIFILGLYDDMVSLRARFKFFVQAIAAVWLYLAGFGVYQMDLLFGSHALKHALALPLTIFWVLLITNAFNLIDGLDGLAAGSALFSTLVVVVISLVLSNHLVSFLAIALAGAILGFLRFNFNPASIFLGDSGSLFIGFMLSALGLAGSQKAQTMVGVAIPVVSFGLPILDVGLAVLRRMLNGKPLFEADREHIHHKLLDRGLSQRTVVLILYGVTAALGLFSLAMLHGQELVALVLTVVGSGICFGVQRLKYHEFSELRRVARRTLDQKQIITNNLNVRHTVESLRRCSDARDLRRILAETFLPLGFAGFNLALPEETRSDALSPLSHWRRYTGEDNCRLPAAVLDASWALKVRLISAAGERCGFFLLHREEANKPLLLDINLLAGDFQVALADAVKRILARGAPIAEHEAAAEQEQIAVSAGVGSS